MSSSNKYFAQTLRTEQMDGDEDDNNTILKDGFGFETPPNFWPIDWQRLRDCEYNLHVAVTVEFQFNTAYSNFHVCQDVWKRVQGGEKSRALLANVSEQRVKYFTR